MKRRDAAGNTVFAWRSARPLVQINGMVLRQTARLGGLGIVIGILGMAGIVPLLDRWVFGISRFDPVTFVSVAAVLCLTTALAALGPAMRASRSDPMASLRAE